MPYQYNVLDYGIVGNGTTDDAPAFQNLIDTVEALGLTSLGTPKAEIYCPPGLVIKLSSGVVISKPILMNLNSPVAYTPTSGVAVTIGGSNQWMQYGEFNFKGIFGINGPSSMPSSINSSGAIGLKINHLQYSKVRVDTVQGFSKYGIFLDAEGTISGFGGAQVIQHNSMDFGQIVNNGMGVKGISTSAATSSFQANRILIQNVYQNFCNVQFDDPTHNATDSNTVLINAMDNSYGAAAGGHGFLNYGKWNHIEIGYTGTDYYAGNADGHNSVRVYNTKATDAKIYNAPSDTSDYYQIGGI